MVFMSKANYKSGVIRRLTHLGVAHPPPFVAGSIQYETMMGSVAYGVSGDTSDVDIYGFCMPPKDIVFPHLAGYISGFSKNIPKFEQYQEHHLKDKERDKEYDISIYSIIKYFRLCMDNNPNMIDSLFTKREMVLTSTKISDMVRENRKMFLHKGAWHKFKGYAYSQLNKLQVKNPKPGTRRFEMVEKFGYDVKFAYHTCRLMSEVEQILTEGDIDLMRNKEQLKSIRRGEWSLEDIRNHFFEKEKGLETIYQTSKLRMYPDEEGIKQLLINCIEEYYGTISKAIYQPDKASVILRQIKELVNKT